MLFGIILLNLKQNGISEITIHFIWKHWTRFSLQQNHLVKTNSSEEKYLEWFSNNPGKLTERLYSKIPGNTTQDKSPWPNTQHQSQTEWK
jgi:hypothetical protein